MNEHDIKAAEIVRNAIPRNGHVDRAKPNAASFIARHPAEAAAKAQQTEASAELAQEAQRRIAAHQSAILGVLLAERMTRGEIASADPKALDEAGALQCFNEPDGSVRFDLNGKPLAQFWPPTAAFDEDGMNVQLPYRVAL